MQHFPVQSHPQAPFAQQYQIVEVSNPVLAGNTIFQTVPSPAGAFLVPLQSHHIVQAGDGQVIISSQDLPAIGSLHIQHATDINQQNSLNNVQHNIHQNNGTILQSTVPQQTQILQQQQQHLSHPHHAQLLQQVQCQQQTLSQQAVQPTIQLNTPTNIIPPETQQQQQQQLPSQTILVHEQIVQPTAVLMEDTSVIDQQLHQQSAQQQPHFVVVNDVGATAEVVEFTDAGTQTILSALSQGETPAISINGDIVGYVNCAEIKSDGAIIFTIGGSCQQKSDITNFLDSVDKKNNHRDAQSWLADSLVATQAMQALISKRPDIRSALPVSSNRRINVRQS